MSRQRIRVPKYRRDSKGRAFVEHSSIETKSKRRYLGRHGTTESVNRYNQFVAGLAATATAAPTPARDTRGMREIAVLVDAYLTYAERRYSRPWGKPIYKADGSQRVDKDGKPILVSSEYHSMEFALRPLVEVHVRAPLPM